MKPKTYQFVHDIAKAQALSDMAQTTVDSTIEWIKRPIKTGKTLAQLGGLFGVWIKHISEQTGDEQDYLHRMLKAKFLARIYAADPHGPDQEQWVELLAIYQERGEQEKLIRHTKRISLSWASMDQMTDFMNAIDNYYASNGYPLPYLDKFRRAG